GGVRLRLGDTKGALEDYRTYHVLCRKLAAADPRNAEFQRDLASSHNRLGDLQLRLGDLKAALEQYRAGRDIRQKLAHAAPADADPADAGAQRDVAAAHANLGDVEMKLGETSAALEEYRAYLGVIRKLAEADPRRAGGQRDLAAAYQRLGYALLALDDVKGAL